MWATIIGWCASFWSALTGFFGCRRDREMKQMGREEMYAEMVQQNAMDQQRQAQIFAAPEHRVCGFSETENFSGEKHAFERCSTYFLRPVRSERMSHVRKLRRLANVYSFSSGRFDF